MMSSVVSTSANFEFLGEHDDELVRLGALAERYFRNDPNTCLIKLRQFGEVLARLVGAKIGIDRSCHAPNRLQGDERQVDLLRRLEHRQITSREEADLFSYVRINGNKAAHNPLWGLHFEALRGLKIARDLGSWFHRTFGKNPKFTPGSFVPPPDPAAEMETLRTELARLHEELVAAQLAAERARVEAEEQQRSRLSAEERVRNEQEDKGTWEQLAKDFDAAHAALVGEITRLRATATAMPAPSGQGDEAAKAVDLDEAPTRGILADLIRHFAFDNYVEPMSSAPGTQIRIRAGDVHKEMKLSARMPAVCAALDARIFQSDFGLELVQRTGPRLGATVEWIFQLRGDKPV